ncbi:CAZyme family AA3 [Paecilomyces variotii]|nr:CAZyme family AA3 [Paecilomyces variotii]KAJ9307180.1 CAZyme family AA3 [Paecilomyces variotii]KAJ9326784.1 CAZyme family AA3 [Paecilomyces variotii]KAJ9337222.1 CAZyme family AA3 [Paecilomyces variotii]KAJ9351917.1 CAZyme family AA3 [Paecilomyces variotii]
MVQSAYSATLKAAGIYKSNNYSATVHCSLYYCYLPITIPHPSSPLQAVSTPFTYYRSIMADHIPSTSSIEALSVRQFDYIVVGGGIGGLVVARRLSDDATKTVLLIEAGANRTGDARIDTPGFLGTLYGDPNYDWDYISEPQKHVNGRQIPQPRGKVLGGSSAINFSAILYPYRRDFDSWSELGNKGWTADDLAPYLRKFHTYSAPSSETAALLSLDYMDPKSQGADGPLPVTFPDIYGPLNQSWQKTFDVLGWQSNSDDPIKGEKHGAFACPLSIDPKTRARAYATAYYSSDVARRPNLQLLTETHVEKVLLKKGSDGSISATDVQVLTKEGEHHQISARREVILSAGSINTPQILELSGIGQEEILNKHGIPVVISNPRVGENLQDHCLAAVSFEIADGQASGDLLRDPNLLQSAIKSYQESQSGPLCGMPLSIAYLPLVDRNGIVSKDVAEKLVQEHLHTPADHPGIKRQYEVQRQTFVDAKSSTAEYLFLPAQLRMQQGKTTMGELLAPALPGNYISILILNNHPFSRGSVHIRSADPLAKPVFDPNYLSQPIDLEVLARHTQYLEQIVQTAPFSTLLKSPSSRIPEEAAAGFEDLELAKKVVKDRLFTCFHPAGTCAMLPKELGGVVNDRLVVHGTKNLRVVDASVFPLEPTGNIQATVFAVAEKAADLIKEDNKN